MGFFKKEEIYDPLKGRRATCLTCGRYRKCKSPKLGAFGSGQSEILHIMGPPSRNDDKKGSPLSSSQMRFYGRILGKRAPLKNALSVNVCQCYSDEDPSDLQMRACFPRIQKLLKDSQPRLIFLIGADALKCYLGHRYRESCGSITKWRGFVIPDHTQDCWLCPVLPPQYILNIRDKNPAAQIIFEADINRGLDHLNKPLPAEVSSKDIHALYSDEQIAHVLKKILHIRPKILAFDYETTGLKPYMKGHKLWCISLCWSPEKSYAFDLRNISAQNRKRLTRILGSPLIGKTAHNMKFEHTWTRVLLKTEVKGWLFDTMIGCHVLDNRPGITSLKFNAAVELGVFDYDSDIKPFLKGTGLKGANNINEIHRLSLPAVLEYCGMDSLVQFRLCQQMMERMGLTI